MAEDARRAMDIKSAALARDDAALNDLLCATNCHDHDNMIVLACLCISDNEDFAALQYVMKWRGPGNEWFDPRAVGLDAWITFAAANLRLLTIMLAWRGPGDERMDPTVRQNVCIQLAVVRGCLACVQLLLDWRGLHGERVDPTAVSGPYSLLKLASTRGNTPMLHVLLAWRGHGGKCFPLSEVTMAAHDAMRRNDVDTARTLLHWRGPEGERVDMADVLCPGDFALYSEEVKTLCVQEWTWSCMRRAWVAAVAAL